MVPSSAPIAEPQRPAMSSDEITGESSRTIDSATSVPTKLSALTRFRVEKVCSAITMPVKSAVSITTGSESTPTRTICRTSCRGS
jgi:hypothetical protein